MPVTRIAAAGLALAGLLATASNADTALTAVPLPGGTSAVGAFTLASVYGQPSRVGAAQAGAVRLEPGFLCIEADDLPIPGDLNGDGVVDATDVAILLDNWGAAGPNIADLNGDGFVGSSDFSLLLNNWGP